MTASCRKFVRRRGQQRPCLLPAGHDGMHVAKAIAAQSEKRAVDNVIRYASEQELGRDEGMGVCARCQQFTYVNGHELVRRSQGGDPTRPDCLLCPPCNSWAASNPVAAAWTGWLITPKHPHAPELENGQAYDLNGCVVDFTRTLVADSGRG